jgi:hypothetical protein
LAAVTTCVPRPPVNTRTAAVADGAHLVAGPKREQRLGRLPVVRPRLDLHLARRAWISVTTATGSFAQASGVASSTPRRIIPDPPCPHVRASSSVAHLEHAAPSPRGP